MQQLAQLSTPMLADAVVRLGLPARQAPAGITGPDTALVGPALPVRHYGSVDVFLEALNDATEGDVMVIDNGGRQDEGCIGDLIVHEAQLAGIAGIVVWGTHRDAQEIAALGLPVFSYGTVPFGPTTTRQRDTDPFADARIGDATVGRGDLVVADSNGVIFLPKDHLDTITAVATAIRDTEAEQTRQLRQGHTLRQQLDLDTYIAARRANPERTFRQHLRELGGAIEE